MCQTARQLATIHRLHILNFTLFKDVPILEMHICGHCGEIGDYGTENAQHGSSCPYSSVISLSWMGDMMSAKMSRRFFHHVQLWPHSCPKMSLNRPR